MAYQVLIPKPVAKQLDSLPREIQQTILARILQLKDDPRPSGCVKLKGYDREYRIRIGSYRVRFEVDDAAMTVVLLHCMHRKDVYR
jgi:mRNA interferase RelE/StbE